MSSTVASWLDRSMMSAARQILAPKQQQRGATTADASEDSEELTMDHDIRFAAALSTRTDLREAVGEVCDQALARLGGQPQLAVLFTCLWGQTCEF